MEGAAGQRREDSRQRKKWELQSDQKTTILKVFVAVLVL